MITLCKAFKRIFLNWSGTWYQLKYIYTLAWLVGAPTIMAQMLLKFMVLQIEKLPFYKHYAILEKGLHMFSWVYIKAK